MTAVVELVCYYIIAFFLDVRNVFKDYSCDQVWVSNGSSNYVMGKRGRVAGPFANVDTVTVKCMKGGSSFDVPVRISEIIQEDNLLGFLFLLIIGTIMILFLYKKRTEFLNYLMNKFRTEEEGGNVQQALEYEQPPVNAQQPPVNAQQPPVNAQAPAIPENPPQNGHCGVRITNEQI